jgi:ADP-heptose:LPS heptosyltransferase
VPPSVPVPGVRKIAVVRANALGDYIFSLPALDALRARYPTAEIVLLGRPWHVRELSGRPGPVDRFVAVPALPGIRTPDPGEAADPQVQLAELTAEQFDLALQLHGGGRHTNELVQRLGARVSAGLRSDDAPPLDRWLRYIYYQPEVFRYLEVVGLVGAAPVGYTPVFRITARDRAEARAVAGVPDRPRVGLHPGATDPRRRWPMERFASVADALAAAGCEVVATGTAPERDLLAQLREQARAPIRPVVGRLSLGGLAALYASCALVIANDTGPLHLAAAVGTATIGLYWVGNLINGAPVGREQHRALASWTIHCPRCGVDCTRDLYPERDGGPVCAHPDSFVADIPVAEVVADALDLLAGSAIRTR